MLSLTNTVFLVTFGNKGSESKYYNKERTIFSLQVDFIVYHFHANTVMTFTATTTDRKRTADDLWQ